MAAESVFHKAELGEEVFDIVVVCDVETSQRWRRELCEQLVLARPAFVICWGIDCISWHDEADWSYVNATEKGLIPQSYDVMTAWHDEVSLAEAFWFAQNCTGESNSAPRRIIHVSKEPAEARIMDAWAYAESPKYLEDNPD